MHTPKQGKMSLKRRFVGAESRQARFYCKLSTKQIMTRRYDMTSTQKTFEQRKRTMLELFSDPRYTPMKLKELAILLDGFS